MTGLGSVFLGCAYSHSPIAAGGDAKQQVGAGTVGLATERNEAPSGWKEDMVLKLRLVFSVVQRASPILATSFS